MSGQILICFELAADILQKEHRIRPTHVLMRTSSPLERFQRSSGANSETVSRTGLPLYDPGKLEGRRRIHDANLISVIQETVSPS